jgi:L-malate glycosyltransferase
MKICYLAPASSIHTIRWVNFFAGCGDEVHLISKEKPLDGLDPRIIFHPLHPVSFPVDGSDRDHADSSFGFQKKPGLLYTFFHIPVVRRLVISRRIFRVNNLIRKINPDILHAHYVTDYGLLGALTGFHPFCVSVLGSDILQDSPGSVSRITRWILRKADRITCDGENTLAAIITLGIPKIKISMIFHGIDTAKFSPSFRDPGLMTKIVGIESAVVISIRGLKPVYDPETVIRAVPLVLDTCPGVHFIVAGTGPEEQSVKNLAESLGVSSAVRFTGMIAHPDLPPFLASSDVYVSASLSDGGVAISTFEAMASGVPPVVTDVGDNASWIKNGENGFIVPVRSPESLAEKIIWLLEHPEERDRIGKINREIVIGNQDYYKEMEKVHVLYRNLVGR